MKPNEGLAKLKQVTIAIIAGQLVVGGAERQLYLLLSRLNSARYKVIVISLHPFCDDYWEQPIRDLGIPLFFVPRAWNPFIRLTKIISILKPYKPDLIQAWHLFASPYAGLAARWLNTASLAGFRDSTHVFRRSKSLSTLALRLTDEMLVNSETTARDLRLLHPSRSDRIISVQNAVLDDFLDRSPARRELSEKFGLDGEKIWIGSIGRFDPKKRFDLLLTALSMLPSSAFQCLLIGDGPEMAHLRAFADRLELRDKVVFTGEVPFAAHLMKGLDLFAFTSLDEGLPNVIMEAGAAGLPVVTWDLPFYRELLTHQQNALLTPAGDLPAFVSALAMLIDDPIMRRDLGNKATETLLSSFGLERMVENMSTLYERMLSLKRSAHKAKP